VELTWPLVGRSVELQRVTALLGSKGGAVILAGAAGVGKTRLAAECLSRAETAGYLPLRVSATSATSRLPFGAYSNLLPDLAGGVSRANLLGQVAQAIMKRGHGKPVAILVDDAHLLDDSSAALTHHLVEAQKTFVVVTLRSGAPASDAVVALWKDELAERVEVPPLDASQVQELLEAALGGPLNGPSLNSFLERAQGNALFLKELVLGALEQQSLRREQGVWRLTDELPLSARISEIIQSRLSSLTNRERRALGVLAVGEPLAIDIFDRLEPQANPEALERKGMLRIERDDRRLFLRLVHPLYGESLRAGLSPLTLRKTAGRLADAVESFGARRRTDVLPVGVWRLEGGGPFEPQFMLRAAMTARLRNDFALAEKLARAALDAGAGFDAALLLGQLTWYQKRALEAEEYLASLQPSAKTDAQKALLASARIEVNDLGLNDTEAAVRIAEEAEKSITAVENRDHITSERARILGRRGQNGAAVALAQPLLERASGRTLIAACFAAGTSMPVTGQAQQAIDATELGYKTHLELVGPPVGFPPELHLALQLGAYCYAGFLAEAWRLGNDRYAKAVADHNPMSMAFIAIFQCMTATYQGRPQTGLRFGVEAITVLRRLGFPMMERIALGTIVLAQAVIGRVDEARASLAEIDDLKVPPTDHAGSLLLQARAWVEVAANDIPRALEFLGEAAGLARWSGAKALESFALHDLARLGRAAAVADPLAGLCADVQGPFAPARAAHALALAGSDPRGLEEASKRFEQIGAMLVAAEASADAAVIWRRQGDLRRATAAERRSAYLAAHCEGATSPALSIPAPARAALTPRELEIARLAVLGLANKEIAQRLVISRRTVENKLHSAYAKLGVSGRAELAAALEVS